ncbi:hypothetical protein AYK26_02250 [Euryarchaeota archaeon SM23-78]|nr:MAG: hypothetical protein AYK26_02250 [Euryarchaeota archaeon SM23-78]MBW3000897.1 DUF2304 family protein [Candidatus Woesearchaeota archaeon]
MEIIQILIIIFSLFALSRAFLRFKDNRLTKNEFIFWAVLWIAVIVVSIIPGITSTISPSLGITRGIDLIVYISIIVIFYLIFRLYVKIENMEKKITSIVRRISFSAKVKKKK